SPDSLISGEQFGLGGIASVRGTELERPISGDSGVSTTVEITTPELAQGLRAIGIVVAGLLRNNNPNGFGKPRTDGLASVGLGLRYARGQFEATADYGHIVKGSRVPLAVNSAAPKKGDDRFYVTVSLRF
ncbi:MAG TPA: ShlB/FhaC/HecB family hemolysin secretion/activation protein, partial [Ramlibacter sp.]|nr:ShlB/FhaC/HecB family hemolysin secretion/activation protein [Ramlibacter sp.]